MPGEVYNLPEVTQIFLAGLGLQHKSDFFPFYIKPTTDYKGIFIVFS